MASSIAENWTEVKDFVDRRGLQTLHYIEKFNLYEIRAIDGVFSLEFTLFKDSNNTTDLNDFENNYKPYANIPLGNVGEISKERILDSFGRIRTSSPSILFESYYSNSDRALLFSEKTLGSGSISRNSTTNNMELSVGTASGDRAVRQTKEYIHYIPGQSYRVLLTGNFGSGKTNCVQRIGYFDDDDGLFFEYNETSMYIVKRNSISGSVVETKIEQSNWNIDTLDGNGPSKLTLDKEKNQIFVIDFQWLGTGKVRFGYNIGGKDIYIHEMNHANVSDTSPYIRSASLPVRFEILNTGVTSGSTKLFNTCISVISEGDEEIPVLVRSINNGITGKNISTSTLNPILSLRINPNTPRSTLLPKEITALCTTNNDILVEIRLNGSLTGANWQNISNSTAQYDTSSTGITGGIILNSFYISKNGKNTDSLNEILLKMAADIDGNTDILTVCARSVSNNAVLLASMSYEELT